MGMLEGRRALVTGGTRGLGRAIATRLAAEGAAITACDLAGTLDGLPGGWRGVALDLATPEAEDALRAAAGDRLDILIANAGLVPPWRRIRDLDRAEWERVFSVNVWGAALALKACAGALAAAKGSAVLMASINGYRAHPDQTLYSATKHAVVGLMRAAALDMGRDGVRVNALAPGPVATEALVGRIDARHAAGGPSRDEALAAMAGETALGRMAREADIADAALYLASDLAGGVTGTLLPVECGLA